MNKLEWACHEQATDNYLLKCMNIGEGMIKSYFEEKSFNKLVIIKETYEAGKKYFDSCFMFATEGVFNHFIAFEKGVISLFKNLHIFQMLIND